MITPEPEEKPWVDEIVAEVRAAREQLLASFDYDLDKLFAHFKAREASSGRKVVSFTRRLPAKSVA